jgi:hypothetical protein
MTVYEYKVVPAPRKGRKGKGVKGTAARFSFAVQELMNAYAADGWEFQRAETLPSDERSGLTSTTTVYRDLLVFRRPRTAQSEPVNPAVLEQHLDDIATDEPDPDPDLPDPETENEPEPDPQAEPDTPEALRERAAKTLSAPD